MRWGPEANAAFHFTMDYTLAHFIKPAISGNFHGNNAS